MSPAPGPDGVLVVDKPAGWTSHDVVARARRLVGTRRVGHAGTLDPMATGVLVLGVGRGTRLLGQLALTRKRYTATIRLGSATVTDDAEGEVTARQPTDGIGEQQVRMAAQRFVGAIEQVPSTVSAVKVDGERAYALARRGEQPRLAARQVTVHALDVTNVRLGTEQVDVDVVVECSTGTYIRALARDLGAQLSVGGHLTALRRTRVGPFGLDLARTLADLEHGSARLLSLAEAAGAVLPTVLCDGDQARAVSHGRALDALAGTDGPVALVDDTGRLLALYERKGEAARALVVFAPARGEGFR
ncbi:tRNA pseudouridine(55) synthase TruB [soil metagenome]